MPSRVGWCSGPLVGLLHPASVLVLLPFRVTDLDHQGGEPLDIGLDVLEQGLGLVLEGLLGGAFSALSYGAASKLKSEDSFAPVVNGLILPILLLSGILLPMTLAAGWLQTVADVNPLTHIVDGVRAVYRGDGGSSDA